jgi:tetratricopeptide (TPR) repeat protein
MKWPLDHRVRLIAGLSRFRRVASARDGRGLVRPTPITLAMVASVWLGAFAVAQDGDSDKYREAWQRGEYLTALNLLDKLIEPDDNYIPRGLLKDRAELRLITGKLEESIADYKALGERYDEVEGLVLLAEVYKYAGRKEEFDKTLVEAQRRSDYWFRYADRRDVMSSPEELLFRGLIAEMRGDDPKNILTGIYKILMEQVPGFAPAFVASGNLALSKGSFATAAGYFEGALALDPNDQEALAGLVKCYWQSRDERLEKTLDTLAKLNPNHPGGLAVRAEMLLDAGKSNEVHELTKKVFAFNSANAEFLALNAAAYFLEDKQTEMEETQKRALDVNPSCSIVFRLPGRIASRHYRFKEGSELQHKALAINPDDHEARAQLGLDLLRLGDDEAGRQELTAAFEADRYNVQVFNSLNVLDSLDKFKSISRGSFTLQFPAAEEPIIARSALDLLDDAATLLQAKYNMTMETPVRVQIFDNHDDFMVRSVGLPGSSGHLGICFGKLVTMDSPSARPKGSSDWHSVLWHEFTHVITLQKTKNRMPRWLSEGISVFEEKQRNTGWGMNLDPNYKKLLDESGLPGVADLELYFTQPKTPGHLMLGYFLAGEFVKHYVAAYGQAALVVSLDRMGAGEAALDSLAASANTSARQMDQAFQDYLKKRLEALEYLEPFAAALQQAVQAAKAQNWIEAETAYRKAYELFPEYEGPSNPLIGLAEVYEATGKNNELRETLHGSLGLHTANLDAWRKLASLYEQMADWAALEKAAIGAAAVDPFDSDLCRLLLRAQRQLGVHDKALDTVERLLAIDTTHAPEYRLARIELLMKRERWDEAKQHAVRLLEDTPNYWEAQEHLLTLVEQTEAHAVN